MYDLTLYVGEAGKTASNSSKVCYDTHLARDDWQHLTVTMSADDGLKVYINGAAITYQDAQQGTKAIKTVLAALLGEKDSQTIGIKSMKYAAIGRSFYTSDADFKGYVDDFSIYNTALSATQVAELYNLPQPVVQYDFKNAEDTEDLRQNCDIVTDDDRGNVLELKGGSNGTSYMNLPETVFDDVTDELTISTWVKADSATNAYSKLFDASNSPLGQTSDGGNNWSSPDFALAAGGSVYDLTLYTGEAGKTATDSSKVCYDTHLTRDVWQYLTVTLSADEGLKVYINGAPVTYQDAQQGTKAIKTVLAVLFGQENIDTIGIQSMKYAAIGRSFYTSDSDFKGYVDDFSIFASALSADQVSTLYKTYKEAEIPTPTLSVDLNDSTGEFKHGASGFLYGLGEDNVPSTNTLTPLKPNIIEQKPMDGLQHPSGDALDVAESFLESGGKLVQVACPDIYANWPYENSPASSDEDWQDYADKLKAMVTKGKEAGLNDKLVYVPYNEPEGNWFTQIHSSSSARDEFNEYWLKAYNVIKSVDPDAMLAGPNLAYYSSDILDSFVKFCSENNCLPDQFTWHVLSDSLYTYFGSTMDHYQSLEKKYGFSREVVINEYGAMTDMGNPGKLVKYLGMCEDYKVNGCLAYWHLSNNLADIAADENEPNGTWWMYKWYGGMSGDSLKITQENTTKAGLYGVASLDESKKSAEVLFGGVGDTSIINLNNLTQTDSFKNSKKVSVKLETTRFTGINGMSEGPSFIQTEICAVDDDGNVSITVDNMDAAAAYHITVTPAADSAETGVTETGDWSQTYEAEDGDLEGSASTASSGSWTYSGAGQVQNLNNDSDSVTLQVDVPEDGYYQYDMVYGAATGNNTYNFESQNPLNGKLALSVDGGSEEEMILLNTLSWFMCGQYTETLYLTAGSHTLKISGVSSSSGKATVDCVYLTYLSEEQQEVSKTYEAEQSDFNVLGTQTDTTVHMEQSIDGYTGTGYVTGLDCPVESGGGIRYTTCVDADGFYNVAIRYSSEKDAVINLYLDNTAVTLNRKVEGLSAPATKDQWSTVQKTIYLQKGLNILDLDASDSDLALDNLILTKSAQADTGITTIEAEDCDLSGCEVNNNTYASGGKYVSGILGDESAEKSLTVTYTAPRDGNYKLIVTHSNDQLFGKHSYNAQMVDRYITLSVNDGTPSNIYFRNTYSKESFKTQIIDVTLKKGENKIKIWNDDARVLKNGVGGVNTCINYTPNFDKFSIASAVYQTEAAADNTVLQTLYTSYQSIQKGNYTDASWATFTEALQKAASVLSDPSAEQETIDEVVARLNQARSGLTPKTSSGTSSSHNSSSTSSDQKSGQSESTEKSNYPQGNENFRSDTTADYHFTSSGTYIYKITTPDTMVPSCISSNPSAVQVKYVGKTKDGYLFQIISAGSGEAVITTTAGDGTQISFNAYGSESKTLTSDTPYQFSMNQNNEYQYKFTSADGQVPIFSIGSSELLSLVSVTRTGNTYYVKVKAVKPGSTGLYAAFPGQSAVRQSVIQVQ